MIPDPPTVVARLWIRVAGAGLAVLAGITLALAVDAPRPVPSASAKKPETASPTVNDSKPAFVDFPALARLVADRNIFDPERRPRTPGERPRQISKPKPAKTEAPEFGLVGVMTLPRGTFAFFDGNAAEYRKAVGMDGKIAGHNVAEISPNSVVLVGAEQKKLVLKVGARLRQGDDTDWQPAVGRGGTFSPASGKADLTNVPKGSEAATADPAADEILKRLLKKREQELK